MSRLSSGFPMQSFPLSPWVKRLIIINVGIWILFQMVIEKLIFGEIWTETFFAMTPKSVVESFYIWQPFTYMFFHADNVFHVLMNMISLWFFGSELEYRWGSNKFLRYYLFCGVGAALIYILGVILLFLIKGTTPLVYIIPVIGASGAVFGVLLAYAILFGERTIYFFGAFPMQARVFIALLAAIEIISLLSQGMGQGVANLAHIGGLVSGYLYLVIWSQIQKRGKGDSGSKKKHNLRLVVDNEKKKTNGGPKYWN